MRSDLHAIALEIFQFCNNSIELEVLWIPRTEIGRADYISRIIDKKIARFQSIVFMSLEKSWGFIQRIVLQVNVIIRFSLDFGTHNAGCSGVDFFVQNLEGENCLVVPPVSFIARVIHYCTCPGPLPLKLCPFGRLHISGPLFLDNFLDL